MFTVWFDESGSIRSPHDSTAHIAFFLSLFERDRLKSELELKHTGSDKWARAINHCLEHEMAAGDMLANAVNQEQENS